VTSERYIGKKVSEASEHRSAVVTGLRSKPSASSVEAFEKYFATKTEFVCGHGRLYWKVCKNCHRDKESAAQWFIRLLPRLSEMFNVCG